MLLATIHDTFSVIAVMYYTIFQIGTEKVGVKPTFCRSYLVRRPQIATSELSFPANHVIRVLVAVYSY